MTPALKYTDYCIINELETQQTTGVLLRGEDGVLHVENMKAALQKLHELGVAKWAVIHCPEIGCGMDENGNTVNLVVDKQGNKYVKGEMVNYAYTGKTVKAYRDYVDANGKVLKTELLHTDTYKHRDTSYKCTPYVEPEIPEEPDEPDPTEPTRPY